MKQYVILINEVYLRNTEMWTGEEIGDELPEDFFYDHDWKEFSRPAFLGFSSGRNEEEAVKRMSSESGYPEYILEAIPNNPFRIEIPLYEDTLLVAEKNFDDDYKEIYVGIEKDGVWWQDLTVNREEYRYNDDATERTAIHQQYEVLVYGDSDNEDWTESFQIAESQEEDNPK